MKRNIKISVVFALILLLALALLSCSKTIEETKTVVVGANDVHGRPIVHTTLIENIGEYTVVRAEMANDVVKTMASDLRKTLSALSESELAIGTDMTSRSDYEILVGETARTESKKAMADLGYNDYIIKLDGTRIVICGGSDSALEAAIAEFTENFFFDGMLVVPNGEGLRYSPDYKLGNIKIKGEDISEYLVYSEDSAASALFAELLSFTYSGQQIEVAKELEEGKKYIILSGTSLEYAPYKAEFKDGNLCVEGSYSSVTRFLDHFASDKAVAVNIESDFSGSLATPTFYTKDQLMGVLQKVYDEDKIILGEQTNITAFPGDVIKRFRNATGEEPGMIGIDVGSYGLDIIGGEVSDARKSRVFCELIDYAAQGGIVQIHSHFRTPIEGWQDNKDAGRGVIGGEESWAELITDGTALNEAFDAIMAAEAEYVKLFSDMGLPVLWRPFHEMNANWFWWGVAANGKTVPASCFTELWIYMYEYYKSIGVDDLVWVYSPNNSNWISVDYCYPGDEYVDIVGLDWYTNGGYEINDGGKSLTKLMNLEKIVNICEFGIGGDIEKDDREAQLETFSCLDFESLYRQILSDGFKLSYVLTWTSQDSTSWWGKGEEMMSHGFFLGRGDVESYFAE